MARRLKIVRDYFSEVFSEKKLKSVIFAKTERDQMMTDISESEVPNGQLIDLTKLTLPQLVVLRQQVDRDLTSFKESGSTLSIVQQKFQSSFNAISTLNETDKGKEALLPLTQSLYAIGSITDIDNVLIDIGTGYYINQNRDEAKQYLKRKVEFLGDKLQTLKSLCIEKQRIRATIDEVIELKVRNANEAPKSATSN